MPSEEDSDCTIPSAYGNVHLPRRIEALAMRYKLICGDNLEVLRRQVIAEESVDLVYLDPPFNSDKNYNLLFKKRDGALAVAFQDTWQWGEEAQRDYDETVAAGGKLAELMTLLGVLLKDTDMLAYLAMMAPRLVELRRVLRPTGSLYLHCDPSASHYLKMLLDAVFGPASFKNEIVWKRTSAHSSAKRYGPIHDIILFYTKGNEFTWSGSRLDYDDAYLDRYYRFDDGDGRLYWRNSLTAAGTRNGSSGKPWRGFDPNTKGSHWKFTIENLDALDKQGRIYWPPNGGWPYIKRYRDELKGMAISDLWDDINKINPAATERLGYPTQKPLALLARIVEASSNMGDVVLDPFCGCGTTIEAANQKGRQWIGIDISPDAIDVIRKDRISKFGDNFKYQMIWFPRDMEAATIFAQEQPIPFQDWAVEKLGGITNRRRSGDRGVDGRCYFKDDVGSTTGPTRQIIVSVKSGKLSPSFVRELEGAVDKERAAMGVLLTLKEPSRQCVGDAAGYSFYHCAQGTFPRIQIITVKNILDGARLKLPQLMHIEGRRAVVAAMPEQRSLFTAS